MTRNAKLIEKARNNPSGLRFQEFETMLKQCGWCLDHHKDKDYLFKITQEKPRDIRLSSL